MGPAPTTRPAVSVVSTCISLHTPKSRIFHTARARLLGEQVVRLHVAVDVPAAWAAARPRATRVTRNTRRQRHQCRA
jgi:hypothetical protein